MRIRLNVERLVLEGLPLQSSQGPLVQGAFEAELARLLAESGRAAELASGAAVPRLNAQGISIDPLDGPQAIGRKIAGSVHGSLGK